MIMRCTFDEFRVRYPATPMDIEDCQGRPGIAAMLSCIYDPTNACFPTGPRDVYEGMTYWEPCCYLLHVLMGWTNPAKGLMRWFEHGKETHGDRRLEILKELWDDAGQLELLAAYYWRGAGFAEGRLGTYVSSRIVTEVPYRPKHDWWQAFERRWDGRWPQINPYTGGGNPLHLFHFGALWEEVEDADISVFREHHLHRATYRTESVKGWYDSLYAHAGSLGSEGWEIDVEVAGVYVGRFRRSPVTGLFYQGPHWLHLTGNVYSTVGLTSASGSDFYSEYDEPKIGERLAEHLRLDKLRLASVSERRGFSLVRGAVHLSAAGKRRTIVAYAFSVDGEPVYVIRTHENGKLVTKRAWTAHVEYSDQISTESLALDA